MARAKVAPQRRHIEYMPLPTLLRAKRNGKRHDHETIAASFARFGFVETPTLDERTGRLVAGHGRLDQIEATHARGADPPEGVIVEDGEWLVPVTRGWASANDYEAEAYLVVSNRSVELGGWDRRTLADQLLELRERSTLEGTGFASVDLDDLLASLSPPPDLDELAARVGEPKPDDFWPVLRFKVHPLVRDRFNSIAGDDGTDAERFERVVALAERNATAKVPRKRAPAKATRRR